MTGIKGRRPGADAYAPSADAVGSLYYKASSGLLVPLAPGTSGHVVTSNGSGAAPSYQAAGGGGGGGGPIVLQTITASASSSLDAASWANASLYNRYSLELHEIVLSGSDNLWLRFSTNGGSSYDTSGIYSSGGLSFHAGGSGVAGAASGATKIVLGYDASSDGFSTASGWGVSAVLDLFHIGSTGSYKQVFGTVRAKDSLGPTRYTFSLGGTYESLTAVNALRVIPSGSNTITSGKLIIRGWPG